MDAFVLALREHAQWIRLAMFAIFVVLGVVAMLARGNRRRTAIQLFIAYTLAANFFVVIARVEAWPFSRYPMMAVPTGDPNAELSITAFRAVDAAGREWRIDSRAWSPLFPQAVMGWVVRKMPQLEESERREALRFLLRRAEAARVAARNGNRTGNEILLGPLSAPDTNLNGPEPSPPPSEFVELRIYRFHWVPTRRDVVRRELLASERVK